MLILGRDCRDDNDMAALSSIGFECWTKSTAASIYKTLVELVES